MSDKRKVNVDGEDFEVSMEKEGDFWKVEVEGKIFSIKVDGSKGGSLSPRKKKGARKTKRSGVVSSSIPGKIISISASQDDFVSEGDVIMILEAMKMQNEISSPVSGVVTDIFVEEGQSVESNFELASVSKEAHD